MLLSPFLNSDRVMWPVLSRSNCEKMLLTEAPSRSISALTRSRSSMPESWRRSDGREGRELLRSRSPRGDARGDTRVLSTPASSQNSA